MTYRSANNLFLTLLVFTMIIFSGFTTLSFSQTQKKTLDLKSNPTSNIILNTPFNKNLRIEKTKFPDRICDITNYGAISDKKTKNTQAFDDAIADCAKQGGGKIVVPPGIWLTGPIHLESNINLNIQKGAQILFTTDFADYLPVVFSRFEGVEYYNYSPPIYAQGAENVAITGEGSINGQGDKFWWSFKSPKTIKKLYKMGDHGVPVEERVFGSIQEKLRPTFVEFVHCNKVLISGITIINGPMWTIHPLYSQNIIIKNVNIQTNPGPSTDGVNIDSSKNVLVENSIFSTGDDAIAIKSGRDNDGRRVNIPSENIVLQNCTVDNAHGAVAIGSEMSSNVQNVLAQNFIVNQAQYGLRIKSNIQRSGTAKNIWVKNFKIDSLSQAVIQFNTNYERGNIQYKFKAPLFQDIHVSNITCHDSNKSIKFLGLAQKKTLDNIQLKDIHILKSHNGLKMNNADNITLDNISIIPKYGSVFNIKNSQNILLSHSSCNPSTKERCLSLSNNTNIQLKDNDF